MDLETILHSSNKEILEEMYKVPPLPHSKALHPEKFIYLPTTILLKLFQKNYRTHTFKFADELGESIRKYGQLEPILLTKNGGEIIGTDGRGRFWSNVIKGADYMPVEILYNVPPLLKLQMEIDLNTTKTKIDNEDIARLAKEIFDGLLDEYAVLSSKRKTGISKAKSKAIALTAEVMCRGKKTIRKYLRVANLDKRILEDNAARRNAQSFEKLNAIALTFKNPQEQWTFYQAMREKEKRLKTIKKEHIKMIYGGNEHKLQEKLSKLEQEETTLNRTAFYGLLLIKKNEAQQKSFLLTQTQQAESIRKNDTYKAVEQVRQYIFGTQQLLRRFPELKKGLQDFSFNELSFNQYLQATKAKLLWFIDDSSPQVKRTIKQYFNKNKKVSFEEKMLAKAQRQKEKEFRIVRAVGKKPEYIPLEQIIIDENQLRREYDSNAINLLAEKIAAYGQVKPGLVIPIGTKDDKTKYKVVVGNSRYQACKLAKTGYFKAFIRDDLKPHEAKIYQAIEDMFEQDTILERSAMLHRMYRLAEKKATIQNEHISIDSFVRQHRHLGTPGKLKKIMSLLDLPKVYQDMIKTQLITADGALAVNELPKEYHLEFLFPLMTNRQYKHELKKEVKKKLLELKLEQQGVKQLSAIKKNEFTSYINFYQQLTQQIESVLQHYRHLKKHDELFEKIKNNKAFYLSLAKTYEEINSLQKELA